MPFAVTQWGYSPDPRGPAFAQDGWDFGQVPPWLWVMSSTNATGIYSFLNDGIVIDLFLDTPGSTLWRIFNPTIDVTRINLAKLGFEVPVSGGTVSIAWSFDITSVSPPRVVTGEQQYLFPKAIRKFGPWDAVDVMGPVLEIPDGITITPAKWNFKTA